MSFIDYGDVPTWVATVVATGALVAGYRAYRRQDDRIDLHHRLFQEQHEASRRAISEQQEITRQLLAGRQELDAARLDALHLLVQELEQALAAREREATARRSAQAAQVYVWRERRHLENPPAWRLACHVRNSSREAVYDVGVRWYAGSAPWGDPPRPVEQLLPDAEHAWHREWSGPGDIEQISAVVEFRDAAGEHWLRQPGGELVPRQSGPAWPTP